jgi:hypothetical protein
MEVWDNDGGHIFGVGSARDLIDKVYGKYQYLAAGSDSSRPRVYPKTVSNLCFTANHPNGAMCCNNATVTHYWIAIFQLVRSL